MYDVVEIVGEEWIAGRQLLLRRLLYIPLIIGASL